MPCPQPLGLKKELPNCIQAWRFPLLVEKVHSSWVMTIIGQCLVTPTTQSEGYSLGFILPSESNSTMKDCSSFIVSRNILRSFTTSGRSCPLIKISFLTSLYWNPRLCNQFQAVRDRITIWERSILLGFTYSLMYCISLYEFNSILHQLIWDRLLGYELLCTVTLLSSKILYWFFQVLVVHPWLIVVACFPFRCCSIIYPRLFPLFYLSSCSMTFFKTTSGI